MKKVKSAKALAKWLIDEYPPFYDMDEEALTQNIQKNILDGWIPYIIWYNETHKNKLTLPTDPQSFIDRVFHKSISKCEITPPKKGQEIKDWLNTEKGVKFVNG